VATAVQLLDEHPTRPASRAEVQGRQGAGNDGTRPRPRRWQDRNADGRPRQRLWPSMPRPALPRTRSSGSPLRSIRRQSISLRRPSYRKRGVAAIELSLPTDVDETAGEGICGRVDGQIGGGWWRQVCLHAGGARGCAGRW